MLVKHPQYRKSLSKNQLRLLALIGKFRFVTVPLLSELTQKNKATIYERLSVLTAQAYLLKTYHKQWRLLGKPAIYSLSSKGIKALRDGGNFFHETVYKNQYKNKSASRQLMDTSLDIATIGVQLMKQYNGTHDVFSKSEITRYGAFIRPLPDLYITNNSKDDEAAHYQLEIIEAGRFTWMIRKRLNAHQEWFEENNEDGWFFEDDYPALLFVCANNSTEKRIHRLSDEGYSDFNIFTTTRKRLETGKTKIWLQYYDEDEELELVAL